MGPRPLSSRPVFWIIACPCGMHWNWAALAVEQLICNEFQVFKCTAEGDRGPFEVIVELHVLSLCSVGSGYCATDSSQGQLVTV